MGGFFLIIKAPILSSQNPKVRAPPGLNKSWPATLRAAGILGGPVLEDFGFKDA